MPSFDPIKQLQVSRILTSGEKVPVGTLAQNHQGIYFAYYDEYLAQFGSLSPFVMKK